MKNKRILYVASSMSHINNFHLDYIRALRRDGYVVDVMARGRGADIDMPFEKKLFSQKNRACRKRIRKILKARSYSAIILNTSLAAFHVRLACTKRRPKTVNIVHGYLFSGGIRSPLSALLLLCEKLVRRRTDAIITMNRTDYEIAIRERLTKGRIYKIRGMGVKIRDEITSPDNIRRKYFGSPSFVLTFVGELSKRKNQKFLISALPKIRENIPTAKLCLVGDGREQKSLSEYARSLGISNSVIFVGARADACDFIRQTDLYVSASSVEGLPFNIIEALGAGRTILASKVKGHEDIIDDGVDGFLFEPGNIADFVNKTCQIYDNKLSLSASDIKRKYLKYEKSSVFPDTLSAIKEAIK